MSFITISLILVSVLLSVAAQILLKQGMSSGSVQEALSSGLTDSLLEIATNYSVIVGLISYVASAGLWLIVLSKVDVSKAYPFVGLGFIGTMMFAYWFLNEPLTLTKVVGTLLILLGVLFVSH